jgi:flagellar biosynthesis GTPase FlhF
MAGPSFVNPYLCSSGGQQKHSGLTKPGKAEHKRLLKLRKEARKKKETVAFEKACLKKFQERKGTVGGTLAEQNKAKRRKHNEQIAQESDDDEEEEYELEDDSEEEEEPEEKEDGHESIASQDSDDGGDDEDE